MALQPFLYIFHKDIYRNGILISRRGTVIQKLGRGTVFDYTSRDCFLYGRSRGFYSQCTSRDVKLIEGRRQGIVFSVFCCYNGYGLLAHLENDIQVA